MSGDPHEPIQQRLIEEEPVHLILPTAEEIEEEFGPEAREKWIKAQTYQDLKQLLIQLRDTDPTQIYR